MSPSGTPGGMYNPPTASAGTVVVRTPETVVKSGGSVTVKGKVRVIV